MDLCTGSGALATALAVLGNMQMDAADISRDALAVARQNARENKAEVTFYCGDLWDALPSGAQYDLIVCNPPYLTQNEMGEISVEVAKEPSLALYGGQDGLDFYRRIASANIYTIVCRQKRHVRVAFQEESDGLRQGKMRESKERRKTWFPSLFCTPH